MKFKFLTVLSIAIALFISACGGKSDADLQKAVTDKLAADKVVGVTAVVKDGIATLTGEVADITVKNKAEASAKVEGIKSVVNSTTLKPVPVATPAATDPALTGKLNEAMKKAGISGLTIEVVGGKATVKGTVPAAKYAEVVKAINESGITGWENGLTKGN